MAVKKLRKCSGFLKLFIFFKKTVHLQSSKLHGGTCMWKGHKVYKKGTWSFSFKNGVHCTNGKGSEYLRAWPPHIKLCFVNPPPPPLGCFENEVTCTWKIQNLETAWIWKAKERQNLIFLNQENLTIIKTCDVSLLVGRIITI